MQMILSGLLPLIIGAAVLPIWIIMTLFLLRGEGGVWKASAFAVGAMVVRLVQGALFGFVFNTSTERYGESALDILVAILLTVVGIFMLVTAVRKWRKEADPDDPPPKWMNMLSGLSTLKAFGIGALLMAIAMKQWVFTLAAIAVIEEAALGLSGTILAYLFFVLAAQSLVLAPIVVYAVAPGPAARLLDTAQTWLERHNRVIMVAVSLIFGTWFLWKGITGLLG